MNSEQSTQNVIIFVHGLSGSAEGTWGKMIEFFRRDPTFNSYALDTYEYPTCKLNFAFWKKMPGIQELAEGLSAFIQTYHSDKKAIVLIGHSLGGLVLRQYILTSFKKDCGDALRAAVMIATPHTGAALGRIGNSISFRHTHLKQLTKGGDILRAILDDWSLLRIEQKIQTLYVTGGMDAIVDGESSKPFHGNDRAINLINYGHVNVIKPDHAGDIRFLTLKKFIEALEPTKKLESGEQLNIGSPLFYRYELDCEPFYLKRNLDEDIRKSLATSNIWLSGPSGTGKSAALTRAILTDGWLLFYFTLDGFSEMPADDLLREICRLFLDRSGLDDNRLSENSTLPETLRCFAQALSEIKSTTQVAFFIEEIPILDDAQYCRFINLAYHLSMLQDSIRAPLRLVWIYSSIIDPDKYLKDQNIKIRERFNFITTKNWHNDDIDNLLKIICTELKLSFTPDEVTTILNKVSGSPRTLKMFLKAYQTESGKQKPFTELLSEIAMDTL